MLKIRIERKIKIDTHNVWNETNYRFKFIFNLKEYERKKRIYKLNTGKEYIERFTVTYNP
jgi:hypothetical protein